MTKQKLIELLEPIMAALLNKGSERWSLVGEPRWSTSFTSFGILISSPHRSRWLERKQSMVRKLLKGVIDEKDGYNIHDLEFHGLTGLLTIVDASEPFGVFDAMFSVPESIRGVVRAFLQGSRASLLKKGINPGVWPIYGYQFKKGNLYIAKLSRDDQKLYIPSSQIFYEMFKCIPEVVKYQNAILNKELSYVAS